MVASQINETNELAGGKSFESLTTLETTKENLSPVIDTQRMGLICVQNRLTNITDIGGLYPTQIQNASRDTLRTMFFLRCMQNPQYIPRFLRWKV